MGMTIEEAIRRYKNNAEYERTHGNLQGCLEFRQLAEWLSKYQKIQEIVTKWHNDMSVKTSMAMTEIEEVVKDGSD